MDAISGFRSRLREALERRGMSQTELARRLEVRVATVNEWLNRETMPSGLTMLRLPGVLAVDGHWLLTGEPRPPEGGEGIPADRRARAAALLEEALRVLNAPEGTGPAPVGPRGRLRKPPASERRRRRSAPGERSHRQQSG